MRAFAFTTVTACLGGLGASCAVDPSPSLDPPDHRFCGWLYASEKSPAAAVEAYDTFAAHASELDAVHPAWWRVASPTTFENHPRNSSAPFYGFHDRRVLDHTTAGGGGPC